MSVSSKMGSSQLILLICAFPLERLCNCCHTGFPRAVAIQQKSRSWSSKRKPLYALQDQTKTVEAGLYLFLPCCMVEIAMKKLNFPFCIFSKSLNHESLKFYWVTDFKQSKWKSGGDCICYAKGTRLIHVPRHGATVFLISLTLWDVWPPLAHMSRINMHQAQA